MPNTRFTEVTLLSWVNTFPIDKHVESVADLSDGVIFSKMIKDLDSEYTVSDLEKNISPSKWLSKKKSLEAVYRSLLRYIGDNCANLDSVAFESRVDFNTIAEEDDAEEIVKLLTIFLMAAVEGPKNREYISLITSKLDTPAQEEIKAIIMNANRGVQKSTKPTAVTAPPTKDNGLALEEAHATLFAEHEALKKKHADFITRFERLQISHDRLLDHSNDTDKQLRSLQESNDGERTDYIRSQVVRIQELEDLIANQEQQLEGDRVLKEKQNRELVSLRPMAAQLTECQDELKELKIENLSLVKKANKVDHYLKKLESHGTLQRENADLRQRLDVLEENQKDYDKVYEENTRHKQTALEYGNRFQEQELNIVELSSQKNALKQELQLLNERISELNERQQHDEKFINDLQEQMRTSTGPMSPGSPNAGRIGLSLEEELEQWETLPNYSLEISRLKSEINLLKSGTGGTTIANLRAEFEESERSRKQLQERYQELFEKYTIEQQQLNAIASSSQVEKNESVVSTRKLYLETNQELLSTKTKLSQLQFELTERDRQLLEIRTDLAAVDEEEIDAIENLKGTSQIVESSLQNDLVVLQNSFKTLTTDYEVLKNQLVAALLSKDQLFKSLESLKEKTPDQGEMIRVEVDRTSEKGLSEQLQKQQTMIQELEHKLKHAQENTPDAQKAANESFVRNLTRENALIATAWYDLTNRIQSNHVVLQRRQDAPKSWLNKQRQMVTAAGRR